MSREEKRPAGSLKRREPAQMAAILLMAVFAALSLALTILQFARGRPEFGMRGVFFPLLLALPLLLRLLKLEQCWRFYVVFYLFLLYAFCYGSVWGAFKGDYQPGWIPPFLPAGWQQALRDGSLLDKVSHFFSGFLFTMLGFCLYYWQAGPQPAGRPRALLLAPGYALFLSAFVAVLWEVFEYFDFALTGNDSQHHLTTGVMDTMHDMMAHMGASLISVLAFVLWRKAGVKLMTAWVVEEFYQKNVEGREGASDGA